MTSRADVNMHQTNSSEPPKFVSLLLSYFVAQYVLIPVVCVVFFVEIYINCEK